MLKILCASLTALVMFPVIVSAVSAPPLPKGYNTWQKSERKLVTDKSSLFYGIHYIYADKKAMKGYQQPA